MRVFFSSLYSHSWCLKSQYWRTEAQMHVMYVFPFIEQMESLRVEVCTLLHDFDREREKKVVSIENRANWETMVKNCICQYEQSCYFHRVYIVLWKFKLDNILASLHLICLKFHWSGELGWFWNPLIRITCIFISFWWYSVSHTHKMQRSCSNLISIQMPKRELKRQPVTENSSSSQQPTTQQHTCVTYTFSLSLSILLSFKLIDFIEHFFGASIDSNRMMPEWKSKIKTDMSLIKTLVSTRSFDLCWNAVKWLFPLMMFLLLYCFPFHLFKLSYAVASG